jgi:glutaminyl-tRNA synthetase
VYPLLLIPQMVGTLHWVCADTAVDVETRLYDYLISPDDKEDGRDFMEKVNTNSLTVMKSKAEPAIKEYPVGSRFQFLRKDYFIIDQDTTKDHLVCNRIVGLRDTWAKLQKKQAKA